MFIGGSPLSTAGGIKTTTLFMVLLAMYSYFRGKHVIAFKRTYSSNMIVKAMSLVFLGLGMVIVALIFIAYFEMNLDTTAIGLKTDKEAAIFFEIFSAFGTVGVTTGLTPHISIGSKIVLCFLMFFGRLGPMTFLQIFQANMDKKKTIHYEYVEEDFLIG
jgi:trk system potassium uptake protein TrkH